MDVKTVSESRSKSLSTENSIRALVIDDSLMSRRLSERMLTHLQCQVFTTEDVEESLEVLRRESVDVVFSDVDLPGICGAEANRLMRETAGGHALSIVAVSGQALGDDRAEYLAIGFDDYLPKPVSIEAFRDCLKSLKARTDEQP